MVLDQRERKMIKHMTIEHVDNQYILVIEYDDYTDRQAYNQFWTALHMYNQIKNDFNNENFFGNDYN